MSVTGLGSLTTEHIAQVAAALVVEDVRSQQDQATTARLLRRTALMSRLKHLEEGRRELLKSATKTMCGGIASAAMQGVGAVCQGVAAYQSSRAASTGVTAANLRQAAATTPQSVTRAGFESQAGHREALSRVIDATAQRWVAARAACETASKPFDLYAASGASNHAEKIISDIRAETEHSRAQDADQALSEAHSLRDRQLARMKDLADSAYQALSAAVRA
jgi:hypothetical protein